MRTCRSRSKRRTQHQSLMGTQTANLSALSAIHVSQVRPQQLNSPQQVPPQALVRK